MASERASQRAFFGVSALLCAVSAALTTVWCASMAAMGGMPIPGQTWPGAAASFLGMWVVMMVAMMLPSLTTEVIKDSGHYVVDEQPTIVAELIERYTSI